jgi:hypothetical protein
MVDCTNCGSRLAADSRFCAQCGTAVVDGPELEATGALPAVGASPDTGPQPPVGAAPFAVLVVYRGPNEGSAFELEGELIGVGRAADQQIFLDDITVSRRHAELHATEGGWRVVDLGSLNGTYVNRQPVTDAVLTSGDEVQIGKYRFRYMTGGGVPS